jgi:SAM-dependent methyltransferase
MENICDKVLDSSVYTDGRYLAINPLWHAYESPFKVTHILQMLRKNRLQPKTICEVGCGAGEVLKLLQERMGGACRFWGYDISPQALAMCESKANKKLQFKLADISREDDSYFDLLLVLDVIEHVEDYLGFLGGIRPKSDLKIFHFPLDLSVQALVRQRGLLNRRELYRHLHYFTKETALETLKDTGYDVIDYCYTPRCIEMANEVATKLAILPRKLWFALNQDLAVRVLGGYSLLVLAR